ncbi:hypothetical protein L2E82_47603 [Cichorium intybus]|uniref:Uncharacterized protein n=1 Tax=Cichorium intybus TaxID=13427 RepID=A0ACB8YV61_CICIN|nr:hypothetical protein L2E82_47603 [Cichorium intybus]
MFSFRLAGRLGKDGEGKVHIYCNGEGLLFVDINCNGEGLSRGRFAKKRRHICGITPVKALTGGLDYVLEQLVLSSMAVLCLFSSYSLMILLIHLGPILPQEDALDLLIDVLINEISR